MLLIENLSVFRGGGESSTPRPHDYSAAFQEGEITGLAGRNGSGKTSLSLVLAGILPRVVGGDWNGQITLRDTHLAPTGWPSSVSAAYASQSEGGEAFLGTVGDVIAGLAPDLLSLADQLPLPRSDTRIQHLSSGQKHILEWILCQARRPDIIMMDEGLSSLDPKTASVLFTASRDLTRAEDRVLILIDQDKKRLSHYADNVQSLESPQDRTAPQQAKDEVSETAAHLVSDATRPRVGFGTVDLAAWWPENRRCTFRAGGLDLQPGRLVRFTGGVGAGKSTLLKAISGFPGPRRNHDAQELLNRLRPIYLGSADQFVTGERTIGAVLASSQSRHREELRFLVGRMLPDRTLETDPGCLSFGQRRLVAILSVFMSVEQAVALDEPDKGLDENSQTVLAGLVTGFLSNGGVVFYSSHNPDFAEYLGSSVIGSQMSVAVSEQTRS